MNRKKIYRILSSTISGLYLINTTAVFAQETTNDISIEANADIDISQGELSEKQDDNDLNDESYENLEEDETNNDSEINNDSETNKKEDNNINSDDEELEEIFDNEIGADEVVSAEENASSIGENKDKEKLNDLITSSDNLKKVTTKIVSSVHTIHKPTIDYLDGYIKIKDKGVMVSSSNIENFDSSENLEFNFSNNEWTISGGNMVSKKIGHSLSTKNSIILDLENEATIIIKAKVSSEKNYDWGKIYINGQEVFKQSGTTNTSYTTITQKLNSGTNTIEFEYTKDGGTTSGLDAMFIDEIVLDSSAIIPNCEKLEYRLNGGSWIEYTEDFSCEEGDLIEARAYYNSIYSDIESVELDIANIVDSNLKKELNVILGKDAENNLILKSDLESLTTLNISNKDISDLSGLEHAVNLTALNISNNKISDISIVEKMTKLESIVAKNNEIENIDSISNIQSLVSIDFESNNINNIDAIENLPNLTSINFKKNNITSEKDVNIISNKDSLKSVTISLNIPNLVLNIGEGNSFNNVTDLYLDYSNIEAINISNANKLTIVSSVYSEIRNFNLSNCNSVNSIYLNYSKVDDIDIHDVSSSLYLSMCDGISNTLTIKDCTNFSNISIQGSTMESLLLENLSSNDSITFNLDNLSSRKININNVVTQSKYGNYLNSSHVKSEDVTFENVYFGSANMNYSVFNSFNILQDVQIQYIYASYFETNSDINLSNLNIKNLSMPYMKSKSLKLISCQNLEYINLESSISENIIVENCPKLTSGIYLQYSKINNIYINNLEKTRSVIIASIASENIIIENCPILNQLNDIYRTEKSTIKNLTLHNLNSMTEINFDNHDIENISISDCNSITNISLRNNNITDISKLESLNSLASINISNNHITDISPLKNITSLNINNIEALDQSIELSDITVKEGTVEIDSPSIIDYEGNTVEANEISDKAKIDGIKINLGEYTEGVYDKVIKFESETSKYSVNAAQKITVDGTAPELNITPNKTGWTNENIFLSIEAYDELSGLDYIKLPNGDIINESTFEFEITKNGDYEFEVSDLLGNIGKQTITISNIDTEAPILKVTPNTTDYTKENVILNIEAKDILSGLDYIKLPSGDIIHESTFEFEATKNGDYEFEAVDLAGNISKQTITISNIDTEAPTLNTNIIYNEYNTEALLIIKATDSLSGILNITLPDGQVVDTDTASFKINKNGDYTIEVTDLVGNIYKETIKVDKIQDKPTSDNNDKDDTTNSPTDDESNNNNNNNNNIANDNNDNDNNLDKIPNASGLGVFAPIVTLMSLAIGVISFKKKK